MRTIFALPLPLVLALAAPAFAQGTDIVLTDVVPGAAVTYLELIGTIAPDLHQVDGGYRGTVAMPVRHLAYADDAPISGLPLSFSSASALSFTSGGSELVAVLVDADAEAAGAPGSTVLAIFDPAHPERAIDLADVASDRHTGFEAPAVLELGMEDQGLVVASAHFNSNQGYRSTAVLALIDGRLVDVASVFTQDESLCGMRREQSAALAPLASAGEDRWAPFTVTVTETTRRTAEDCDDVADVVPGTRAVAATFMWDATRGGYVADSEALTELAAEAAARF